MKTQIFSKKYFELKRLERYNIIKSLNKVTNKEQKLQGGFNNAIWLF